MLGAAIAGSIVKERDIATDVVLSIWRGWDQRHEGISAGPEDRHNSTKSDSIMHDKHVSVKSGVGAAQGENQGIKNKSYPQAEANFGI